MKIFIKLENLKKKENREENIDKKCIKSLKII